MESSPYSPTHFDADSQTLTGADTGQVIGLGQKVSVRLAEAVPVTGGLLLDLLEIEERALPGAVKGRRSGSGPRKPAREAARGKVRRVVRRR